MQSGIEFVGQIPGIQILENGVRRRETCERENARVDLPAAPRTMPEKGGIPWSRCANTSASEVLPWEALKNSVRLDACVVHCEKYNESTTSLSERFRDWRRRSHHNSLAASKRHLNGSLRDDVEEKHPDIKCRSMWLRETVEQNQGVAKRT